MYRIMMIVLNRSCAASITNKSCAASIIRTNNYCTLFSRDKTNNKKPSAMEGFLRVEPVNGLPSFHLGCANEQVSSSGNLG